MITYILHQWFVFTTSIDYYYSSIGSINEFTLESVRKKLSSFKPAPFFIRWMNDDGLKVDKFIGNRPLTALRKPTVPNDITVTNKMKLSEQLVFSPKC
jgi:hypothetical protein